MGFFDKIKQGLSKTASSISQVFTGFTEIDDDSSLNLRSEPSTGAEILRRLYKHQHLIVLGPAAEDGWVHVKTDVIEGYVMASFITKVEEAPAVVIATPAPPTPSPESEKE